ncbi:CLUMA_CG006659, isoform A [Clunio marinus]|uniref:CLUMA_CG006659, isoform A n=1 Tax=Clunio marinus TaxID=568069 RepID=A0A1J1HYC1_9DIPT|nr:CLUMA_CG006659, isoform A [Clunio marinus]
MSLMLNNFLFIPARDEFTSHFKNKKQTTSHHLEQDFFSLMSLSKPFNNSMSEYISKHFKTA